MKIIIALTILLFLIPFGFAIPLTNCSTLSTPGAYYTLTNDIIFGANTVCFTVGANNVTLDCRGHTITGNMGASERAVLAEFSISNYVVKNCNFVGHLIGIKDGESSGRELGNIGSPFNIQIFNNNFSSSNTGIEMKRIDNAAIPQVAGSFYVHDNNFVGNDRDLSWLDIISTVRTDPLYFIYDNSFTANISMANSPGLYFGEVRYYHNIFNSANYFDGTFEPIELNSSSSGNYWADPYGTGFSQICPTDNNGICTLTFTAYTGATDYLPLTTWGSISPSGVSPPSPHLTFLGLDQNGQNFVFKARITANANTSVYSALLVDPLGYFANTTNGNFNIYFNDPSDIMYVSNSFCPEIINITPGTPNYLFNADGELFINKSAGCLGNTKIQLPQTIYATNTRGEIDISTGIRITPTIGENSSDTSVAAYTKDYHLLGPRININHDSVTGDTIIQRGDGEILYNGTSSSELYITAQINFDAKTYAWIVHDIGGNLLCNNATTLYPASSEGNVATIALDESSTDGYLEVDYVNVLTTNKANYPSYIYFDTLKEGFSSSKALYQRVGNSAYGNYEGYLWTTDTANGPNYYLNPAYVEFVFDANTPRLTQAQIDASIAADAQKEGFISGDLVTDKIEGFWTLIGVKSTASKIFIGIILLFFLTLILSGLGSEVIIFMDVVGMLGLTYLGLFPAWFTILLVVVGAAIFASAMRRAAGG
jgi:hypothetical protein